MNRNHTEVGTRGGKRTVQRRPDERTRAPNSAVRREQRPAPDSGRVAAAIIVFSGGT